MLDAAQNSCRPRTQKFYCLSTFDSQLMYLIETTAIAESLRGDWIPADSDAARGGEVASRWFLYYRLKRCRIVSSTISALNCRPNLFNFASPIRSWLLTNYKFYFYSTISMLHNDACQWKFQWSRLCIDNALSVCQYRTLWFISRQSTHASLLCAYTATVNARSKIMWCKKVKFILHCGHRVTERTKTVGLCHCVSTYTMR